MQKFINDEIDVSIALTESLLAGIAKNNTSYKFIGTYIQSPLNWAVITGVNSKYNSLDEVEGTKFGISRKGSGSEVMANVMSLEKGWKKSLDFQINDSFQNLRQSVNDGSTSCFMWEWFTTLPYVKTGEVKFIGNQLTPWPSWSIVSKPQIESEKLTKFLNDLDNAVRSFDNSRTNGDAANYVSKTFNYDINDVNEWLKGVIYSQSHLNVVDSKVLIKTLDILAKANVISKPSSNNDQWNLNDFVNNNVAKLI